MNKENKLIPELRFPEFVNDGEWELKQVEEYFDVGSSKRVLQKDWVNKGVPFYRTRELVSLHKNEAFGSEIYISEVLYADLKEKYGVPSEGDFLVSGVGTLGICYQVKASDKFYFKDGNVLWFKLNGELISSYFKYCFQSEHIQNQINAQTSKSTVGTYTIQNARKTEFWYPKKKNEQQKIAACLSSLDDLIEAHNQKLEALKDHKKGLMQNLFPQNGEKVPKFRFPEFVKDGEWVENSFEKICKVNPKVNNLPDEFIYIDLESVSNGQLLKKNIIKKVGAPSRAQRLLQNKDVIYQMVRPYQKNNYHFIVSDDYNYVASTGYAQLRAFGSSRFLFQLIHTDNFVSSVLDKCTGSNYPAINSSALKQIKVFVPEEIEEQKKIASCLSVLDTIITAEANRVEQLKEHKKGLMQGLFPQLSESGA